jgi:hypothetical protein
MGPVIFSGLLQFYWYLICYNFDLGPVMLLCLFSFSGPVALLLVCCYVIYLLLLRRSPEGAEPR